MGYSIELYFERRFEDALRALWDELEKTGVPSVMQRIGSRPHLSLVVFDHCNIDHIAGLMDIGIKGLRTFPINFPAISILPGRQYSVFLTPAVNQGLMDIQKRIYDLFAGNGYYGRRHYEPHHWLPHCSVSKALIRTEALKTLEICLNTATERETWVTEIGFIAFRPRKVLKTIGLPAGTRKMHM